MTNHDEGELPDPEPPATVRRRDDPARVSRRSISGKVVTEALGALGVIASMVFVGLELRQSNVQARAASYQAIGIATAELHGRFDDRSAELAVESYFRPDSLATWSAVDWELLSRLWLESFRLHETLLLQIDQGLLPEESLETLGWSHVPREAWKSPGFVCLWPRLAPNMGTSTKALLEQAEPDAMFDCSHIDLDAVMRGE